MKNRRIEENEGIYWWKNQEFAYGLSQGYYEAAERLLDSLKNEPSLMIMDTAMFPILFLYSHSFEILMKKIIITLDSEYLRTKLIEHDLNKLFKKIKTLLKDYEKIVGKEEISKILLELEIIDSIVKDMGNGSINNRYGKKYEEGLIFNYDDIGRDMDEVHLYLTGLLEYIKEIPYRMG